MSIGLRAQTIGMRRWKAPSGDMNRGHDASQSETFDLAVEDALQKHFITERKLNHPFFFSAKIC